ncbi:transmembrane protein, putative (macronuclear) [Tetrahymena thermophila SB210]|uniref:Transmembrane protein, putative n=1 Tax=Tetrahymena thermophila (strain SB210) TaxID=312017 RepID=Q22G38_TETTS|nr:transmembrane protein, putative [Tetrahymena thermophila SB210]EAR84188.2 transmembrane protein, putative [Tetrahymena thermophila SB210]|eukprot:XP_001031851.2 transmembrane protein, putative [Tetrahymena thermophila SB210]
MPICGCCFIQHKNELDSSLVNNNLNQQEQVNQKTRNHCRVGIITKDQQKILKAHKNNKSPLQRRGFYKFLRKEGKKYVKKINKKRRKQQKHSFFFYFVFALDLCFGTIQYLITIQQSIYLIITLNVNSDRGHILLRNILNKIRNVNLFAYLIALDFQAIQSFMLRSQKRFVKENTKFLEQITFFFIIFKKGVFLKKFLYFIILLKSQPITNHQRHIQLFLFNTSLVSLHFQSKQNSARNIICMIRYLIFEVCQTLAFSYCYINYFL